MVSHRCSFRNRKALLEKGRKYNSCPFTAVPALRHVTKQTTALRRVKSAHDGWSVRRVRTNASLGSPHIYVGRLSLWLGRIQLSTPNRIPRFLQDPPATYSSWPLRANHSSDFWTLQPKWGEVATVSCREAKFTVSVATAVASSILSLRKLQSGSFDKLNHKLCSKPVTSFNYWTRYNNPSGMQPS
jgi:hypothetical protein